MSQSLVEAKIGNESQFDRAKKAVPEMLALMKPRKKALTLGLCFVLVSRGAALVAPISIKFLIDEVIMKRDTGMLVPLIGLVLGATAVQAVVGLSTARMFARVTQDLIVELRCRVQAHILRLPITFHDANKTGALVQRTMQDVQGIQNILGANFVNFIGSIVTAVGALGFMIWLSPTMTGLAFVSLLVFTVLVGRITGRLRPLSRRRARILADVAGRLNEAFGGVRVLKGYRGEAREQAVFKKGVEQIRAISLKTVWLSSGMSSASALMLGIVAAGMMYLGATLILEGAMTLGDFMTYTTLMTFLAAPITQIVSLGQLLMEALAGLDRTLEILNNRPEDEDPNRTVLMPPIVGDVELKDVRFAYDKEDYVLRGVSFTAKPGTVTALVGPSGSGKSTTIGLIAAFYVATEGKALVDGVDIATVTLDSYRSQLGLVLQETFLFDGTILENVAFARPAATEGEVLEACKMARVDDFVQTFDLGYKTIVGERGVKLSGGQRQRISIARALLANPRILILDEATSSLDSHSEALIQEALSHLLEGRTTFVIAHRLSTIRQADQILVVDKGVIVERGKHDELLARKGAYCGMYMQQYAEASNMFLAAGEAKALPEEAGEPSESDVAAMA